MTETKRRLKPRPGGFSPCLFPNGWNSFALSPILPFLKMPISPALRMLNRLQGVFSSFQKHDVRYLVIGGIAAVLYGVPRATFDVDILIEVFRDRKRLASCYSARRVEWLRHQSAIALKKKETRR